MEYIKTNQNCDLLIAYELIYLMHRVLKDGSVSWRCCQKTCNGPIKVPNYNCKTLTPDPAEVEKAEAFCSKREGFSRHYGSPFSPPPALEALMPGVLRQVVD